MHSMHSSSPHSAKTEKHNMRDTLHSSYGQLLTTITHGHKSITTSNYDVHYIENVQHNYPQLEFHYGVLHNYGP